MTTKPKTATPESCPVKALMETASRLVDAYDRVDDATKTASKHNGEAIRLEKARVDILDNLDAVAVHATTLRARSVEGVLFQIALIRHNLDNLDDCDDVLDYRFTSSTRAIVRMLYSIDRAVEELTGHSDKLGGPIGGERAIEYFMSRRLDPHNQIDGFLIKNEGA